MFVIIPPVKSAPPPIVSSLSPSSLHHSLHSCLLISSDAAIQVEVSIIRRGPTTRSGARIIREEFSKTVQEMMDQDDQTGHNQLLIEEMVQLKIQDQTAQ
ncbi:hypothetical protein N665_3613s0003 [Sinapis alba]|nr:hypothetical protein N665_3613s0003 [Sinapis alba]